MTPHFIGLQRVMRSQLTEASWKIINREYFSGDGVGRERNKEREWGEQHELRRMGVKPGQAD